MTMRDDAEETQPPLDGRSQAIAPPEPTLAAYGGAHVIKRSVAIAGHRTSISLEAPFWDALRALAARRGQSLQRLVAEIDAGRGPANLSSAIRVRLLAEARAGALPSTSDATSEHESGPYETPNGEPTVEAQGSSG